MRRLTAAALVAAPAALALAASLAMGPAASAAPYPHLSPESFTITIGSHGPGHGYAAGPVAGRFTTHDRTGTDTVFAFRDGGVNVWHSAIGYPKIDRETCSGFLFDQGRWQFRGLYGDDRNATGYGRFDLFESVQLGRDRYGRCDQRRADVDVYVIGWGQAANPHGYPDPTPTPTTPFAPVAPTTPASTPAS